MTRAKAAALETNENVVDIGIGAKRALQTKKAGANRLLSTTTVSDAQAASKRSALSDVSNVSKKDLATVKETVGLKKPLASSRANLVSKAAQPTGITKPSRTNSTRSTLTNADVNKKPKSSEPKRPASGSGVMAATGTKRRALESKPSNQQIYQDTKSSEQKSTKPRQQAQRQEAPPKVEVESVIDTEEYDDYKENVDVNAPHSQQPQKVEEAATMSASEIAFVHDVERGRCR